MVPMELVGVRLELPANTPIVILREAEGRRRVVPIYIGGPEAAAIHYALEGIEPARPLTHDLLKNVLDELTTSLDRVVVTEVRDRSARLVATLDEAARLQERFGEVAVGRLVLSMTSAADDVIAAEALAAEAGCRVQVSSDAETVDVPLGDHDRRDVELRVPQVFSHNSYAGLLRVDASACGSGVEIALQGHLAS